MCIDKDTDIEINILLYEDTEDISEYMIVPEYVNRKAFSRYVLHQVLNHKESDYD